MLYNIHKRHFGMKHVQIYQFNICIVQIGNRAMHCSFTLLILPSTSPWHMQQEFRFSPDLPLTITDGVWNKACNEVLRLIVHMWWADIFSGVIGDCSLHCWQHRGQGILFLLLAGPSFPESIVCHALPFEDRMWKAKLCVAAMPTKRAGKTRHFQSA